MLVGFVYPVIVHSMWSAEGFLSPYKSDPLWDTGVIDFAGCGVVHLTGGLTALFATKILGPRRGRFHDDEGRPLDTPREFPGHSIALQVCRCRDADAISIGLATLRKLTVKYLSPFLYLHCVDAGGIHSLVWVVWFQ